MNNFHVYACFKTGNNRINKDYYLYRFNLGVDAARSSIENKIKHEYLGKEIELIYVEVRDADIEKLSRKIFVECCLDISRAFKQNAIYKKVTEENVDEFIKNNKDESIYYVVKDRGICQRITEVTNGESSIIFELDNIDDEYLQITLFNKEIYNEDEGSRFKLDYNENSILNRSSEELEAVVKKLGEISDKLSCSTTYIY